MSSRRARGDIEGVGAERTAQRLRDADDPILEAMALELLRHGEHHEVASVAFDLEQRSGREPALPVRRVEDEEVAAPGGMVTHDLFEMARSGRLCSQEPLDLVEVSFGGFSNRGAALH
jgi:hypothetical protein